MMDDDSCTKGERMTAQRTVLIGGGTARTAPAVIGAFLKAGYAVTVTGRDPDRLHAALAAIPGGDAVHTVIADLAQPAAAERAVAATLERWGRVDAMTSLVQASVPWRPFADTTLADFEALILGGLYTTYNLARAVLPAMLAAGGGHLVTIAGGSAMDPAPGRALFGATKAAIVTLTKGIARDYKHRGIVANCLVAGGIGTEAARQYLSAADFAAAATPQEFANALVFLASAEGSGINGAAVELNAREVD